MAPSHDEGNLTGIQSCPNEILQLILENLDGVSLAHSSAVCTRWKELIDPSDPSVPEHLWPHLVSSLRLESPAPYRRFRDLYASLRNHLWLHGQVWMSNRLWTGYILLSHYNPSIGTIDLVNIIACHQEGSNRESAPWTRNPNVQVGTFAPRVSLWEKPFMSFNKHAVHDPTDNEIKPPTTDLDPHRSLFRAAAAAPSSKDSWPPLHIPTTQRANTDVQSKPHPADALDTAFRICGWVVFSGKPTRGDGEIETFAALDQRTYTPDPRHPYRGVWVGDYSEHGCEFVLFHQPNPRRLEAVKITGDIIVPVGEIAFTVPDLEKVLRVADEKEWPGAKVIPAEAQIAEHQFRNRKVICAEMICAGHDQIALVRHLSFSPDVSDIIWFKRVGVEELIYGCAGS